MKKSNFLLAILVCICFGFGMYDALNMFFGHNLPYSVKCTGILLDKKKTYVLTNNDSLGGNTISINYDKSSALMPPTLGQLMYREGRWFMELNKSVTTLSEQDNVFQPYCRTLKGKERYFIGGELIEETILTQQGIKFNTAAGDRSSRVFVRLVKEGRTTFLSVNDEGVGVSYDLKRDSLNMIDLYFGVEPSIAINRYVYHFDHLTQSHEKLVLQVNERSPLGVNYRLLHEDGSEIQSGHGYNPSFVINGIGFEVIPRYSIGIIVSFFIFLAILIFFEFILFNDYGKTLSPVIRSLIAIRILFNAMTTLAIPLALASIHFSERRGLYFILIILLNVTYLLKKGNGTQLMTTWMFRKTIDKIAIILVAVFPMLLWKFTQNEMFLGFVPVLHVVRIAILLLLMVTRKEIFLSNYSKRSLFRFIIVLGYSMIASLITGDSGTFVYSFAALLLVELIGKQISLRLALLAVLAAVLLIGFAWNTSPEQFSKERKLVRLIAPYTSPSSESMQSSNDQDRETNASYRLISNNFIANPTSNISDLVIPRENRSTCFSDYAFFWSMIYGGWLFIALVLSTLTLLIYHLFFLLFLSIRVCRVNGELSYHFPMSPASDLIRFLLALTIIGLIYPIGSNLMLIPLTGQSMPLISISNSEIVFLIAMLPLLENIFNDPSHYRKDTVVQYSHTDVRKSIKWGITFLLVFLVAGTTLKAFDIKKSGDWYNWQSNNKSEVSRCKLHLPTSDQKMELIKTATEILDDDLITAVSSNKKPILRNLASLYYTGLPYEWSAKNSSFVKLDGRRLKRRMSADSLLQERKIKLSGNNRPFGNVYGFNMFINGSEKWGVTHKYYRSVPENSNFFYADLTAEINDLLEQHLLEIGHSSNQTTYLIADNQTGELFCFGSWSTPVYSEFVYDHHYFPGSVKKVILAYTALVVNENYANKKFGNCTFKDFLRFSDDYYAASLLKDLLANHRKSFAKVLKNDFDLPLLSQTEDGYLDSTLPSKKDFKTPLDQKNVLYRLAIGQQRPYRFLQVMEWFTRVTSGKKLNLGLFNNNGFANPMSISENSAAILNCALNSVLFGTGAVVSESLEHYKIDQSKITCKTGTAEFSGKNNSEVTGNRSSSFLLSNERYTIGIMIDGFVPNNNSGLAAKDLFCKSLPILLKYNIFEQSSIQ